jgi:predicted RND superfamily exporter protein
MSARLARFLYRFRIPLTLLIVAGALALAPRAQITHIDNDISAWFSKEDPVLRDYDRLRAEFTGSRTLIVALEGPSVLTATGLDALRRITGDIERIPFVVRAYSLASANAIRPVAGRDGEDAGIEVRPLIPRAGAIDAEAVAREALADPFLEGDLVSRDRSVVSIVVNFDEDRVDKARGETLERIREAVDRHLPPGVRAHYNGSLEISETYNRVTVANTVNFTPPILLMTLGALFLLFRSWRITVMTLCCVLVSVLWAVGLYSLMGFTFNVLSSMLVPLVVVLAIADDVHIVQHYTETFERTGSREAAFVGTISHVFLPLLAAGGTTALGMLSLATSNVHAVRAFGIGAAVGVMADLAISIVLVPTLLAFVPRATAKPPQERWLIGPMLWVARVTSRRPGLVVAVAMVVTAASAIGMLRLRVDTNHINFFSANHPLSQSARVIDQKLSGVYGFQVFFEGPAESMREPATLQRIERLGAAISRLPNVRSVTSLADYVKRIDRDLGGTGGAAVPASRALIAQELFVFALSDEGRQELSQIVASDYSRAQMTVRMASMSSDVVFEQVLRAQEMADRIFKGSGVTPTVTGSARLFAQLDHYLVASQLSSFSSAFFTVFAVIFVVFRSVRFGLLAIAPNMFPVVVVLGLMGWSGISMNVATVMLASIALGIVDDDTIHWISRYRREVASGADTDTAITQATVHEGRASLTTALVNSCAFAVLLLSEYRPSAWFGGLLALTMAVAFLAEVFLVPATIKLLPAFFAAERLRGPVPAVPEHA